MPTRPRATRPTSQTADRALSLLRILAGAPAEGLRLSDMAAEAGLDRATAHRLLSTLVQHGFAEQDQASKRYVLGLDFFTLAAAASNRFDLTEVTREALRRLSQATGDTAMFCQRAGTDIVCLDIDTGAFPIKTLPMDIGSRRPLGCGAAGVAVLAALPDAEAELVLAQNMPRLAAVHGVTAEQLATALAACRAERHVAFPEDAQRRMTGVAVAMTDRRGRPQWAIAVTSIAERLDAARQAEVAALLTAEAHAINDAMLRLPDQQRHRMRWARQGAGDLEVRSRRSADGQE
jgi:DNA-binding IclR family transcriptional regulator